MITSLTAQAQNSGGDPPWCVAMTWSTDDADTCGVDFVDPNDGNVWNQEPVLPADGDGCFVWLDEWGMRLDVRLTCSDSATGRYTSGSAQAAR